MEINNKMETATTAATQSYSIQVPDSLGEIAAMIQNDWKKIYFGAVPYLDAMYALNTINDTYGSDSARSIVVYFLANASTWRGTVAKQVKKKLNSLIKNNRLKG